MSSDELIPTGARRAGEPAAAIWKLAALSGLVAIAALVLLRRRQRSASATVAPSSARPSAPRADPAARVAPPAQAAPAAQRRRPAYVAVLAGVLLALGAGGAVVLLTPTTRHDTPGAAAGVPTWSSWAPAREGRRSIPQQIAAHVGPRYRLDRGAQAVRVRGGPLKLTNLPLTVAIRAPGGATARLVDSRTSMLYRLCGLGDHCAVTPGKPTAERHLLLRREALELALYTFHYTRADHVVVFMPPRANTSISRGGQALLFERLSLARRLRLPLDATLTDEVPRPAGIAHWADRLLVDRQTIPALYNFAFRETPQASHAFLVLDPLYVTPARPPGAPSLRSAGQPV